MLKKFFPRYVSTAGYRLWAYPEDGGSKGLVHGQDRPREGYNYLVRWTEPGWYWAHSWEVLV